MPADKRLADFMCAVLCIEDEPTGSNTRKRTGKPASRHTTCKSASEPYSKPPAAADRGLHRVRVLNSTSKEPELRASRHTAVRSQLLQQRSELQRLTSQAEALVQRLGGSKDTAHNEQLDSHGEDATPVSGTFAGTFSIMQQHNGSQQQLQREGSFAASSGHHATAVSPETATDNQQQSTLTPNERKLLKLLKRMQKDKDKLSAQVEQLLGSQSQLLQQLQQLQQVQAQQETQQQTQQQPTTVQLTSHQQSPEQQQTHSTADAHRRMQLLHSSIDFEAQMVHDLQQLQQQIEELSKEPEQQGQQYTSTAAASTSAGAYSSGMLANTGLSTDAMARGQQQDVIADQAATICDLKRVIAELESQTNTLRTQASKHDTAAAALADCKAQLQQKEGQLQEVQEQQEKLQELSQLALRDALRSVTAAEEERDSLKHQLQEQQAQQESEAREQQALVTRLQQQLQQDTGALSDQVASLQAERQQLLLQLLKATEQISDLHDELGPAIMRGLPSSDRRAASAAAAGAVNDSKLSAGNLDLHCIDDLRDLVRETGAEGKGTDSAAAPAMSTSSLQPCAAINHLAVAQANSAEPAAAAVDQGGRALDGSRVSRVLWQDQQHSSSIAGTAAAGTPAGDGAGCASLRVAAEAGAGAVGSSETLQQAYKELQQQHSELQAQHRELQEEHAQLLKHQVEVSSQHSSVKQKCSQQEQLYRQAQQQVTDLQQELLQVKSQANAAAAKSASMDRDQQRSLAHKQQMLVLAADNARLAVALAESMVQTDLLDQQQQQWPASSTSSTRPLAAAAAAGNNTDAQQQLQLLVSQLVMVQDQVANAAAVSEQQQQHIQQQQEEMLKLKRELQSLQVDYVEVKKDQLQKMQAAVVAALQAAAGPGTEAVTKVLEENSKLQLELLSLTEQLQSAEADHAALQADMVDRSVMEQMDAKNRVLLQEVSRLLADNNQLRQQLQQNAPVTTAAATAGSRPSALAVPSQQQDWVPAAAVRHQSPSRLASSSGIHAPWGSEVPAAAAVSPAAAAAVAAAEMDSGKNISRNSSLADGSIRVRWSEVQPKSPTAAAATAAATAAAATAAADAGYLQTSPQPTRTSTTQLGAHLQQQQQQQRHQQQQQQTVEFFESTNSISFSTGAATAAAAAAAECVSAPVAAPAAVNDDDVTQPTNSDPVALIAAALQKSHSRISSAASERLEQQNELGAGLIDGDSNLRTAPAQQQQRLSNFSGSGSLSGGVTDRASLVAAVLERHKAKQSVAGAAAGLPLSDSSAFATAAAGGVGYGVEKSAGLFQSSTGGSSGGGSPVTSSSGGKDRASIIAAVLAQRQQRASSAAGSTAAAAAAQEGQGGLRGNVRMEPSPSFISGSSAAGGTAGTGMAVAGSAGVRQSVRMEPTASFISGPSAGNSSGGGASRMSTADRASLVAAVLAKHNVSQNK